MNDSDHVLLTVEQVREWSDKKSQLEAQAVAINTELSSINRWLDAASVFVSERKEEVAVNWPPELQTSMIDAVEEIVRSRGARPVSKSEVKVILLDQGYPKERLGNYFYTVIARLKAKDRITVLSDGRLISPEMVVAEEPLR